MVLIPAFLNEQGSDKNSEENKVGGKNIIISNWVKILKFVKQNLMNGVADWYLTAIYRAFPH